MKCCGEPINGILHSTDASAGVAIPIFNVGSTDARTLQSDEFIEVYSIELIAAVGGDAYVLIGPDATLDTGQTVTRGTFGENGGIARDKTVHAGKVGEQLWLVAPAGVVDVRLVGAVRRAGDGTSVKPRWREADKGQ